MNGGPAWYLIGNAYACVPPKNGSTSFKMAVCGHKSNARLREWGYDKGTGPYLPRQIPNDGLPRYLAVREPEERFCSLWRSCQHESYHSESFVIKHGLQGCNPSVLMDVIESSQNEHWEHQTLWLADAVIPVPYYELLDLLGLPEVWENRTEGGNPPFLPLYRIRKHYSRDYDLWNMAIDFRDAV